MELLVRGAAELGVRLDRAQTDQFHRYYQELVVWNRRVNLTAVVRQDQVQTRLFLDSLTVFDVVPQSLLRAGGKFADVGSGAGFPGLPLRIAFPDIRMTLIEATAKKTTFLRHVSRVLGLSDVQVITGRAEILARDPGLRESFDVVLSRAVAKLSVLAELTLPFCSMNGLVIAQKSADVDEEIKYAESAIETMGGTVREVKEVVAGESDHGEVLVVLEKMTPTPDRYPRRPGIPAKRPLRAAN